MRRPPAGTCRRRVGVGSVGRRNRPVRDDDGRSVVTATERHARYIELGARVRRQGRPRRRGAPRRPPACRPRSRAPARRGREKSAKARAKPVLRTARGRRSFSYDVQQRRVRQPFQHRCELPADIDGVVDGRVVAEATGRGEQVHGVAPEQHSAALEPIGHQRVPGGPRAARQESPARWVRRPPPGTCGARRSPSESRRPRGGEAACETRTLRDRRRRP